MSFSLNYTFWLNLLFGALAIYLFWVSHRHPMNHGHAGHHGEGEPAGGTPSSAPAHHH